MQQNQKKTEVTSKKTSSFAQMMLQRDKDRLKTQQKHAYIELLKAPRGKEYLRLLAETTRLCRQLKDVEDEIAGLEVELEQEAVKLPASDVLEERADEPEMPDESEHREEVNLPEEEAQDESRIKVIWKSKVVQEVSEIQTAKEQTTIEWTEKEQPNKQVSWKRTSVDTGARIKQFKEKQQRLTEMKRQREEMAEQFRTAMREFEAQLPVPAKMVGIIWPEWNTEILMKYGVISCPGSSFDSPEELIEQVKPKSEQEERQWLKGNEAYQTHFCEELLLVEIYMDAVCVVYKDGNTLVIE